MNSNRRVFLFVIYSVGIFLIVSIAGSLLGFKWMPFNRVNLIADVMHSKDSPAADSSGAAADSNNAPVIVEKLPSKEFMLYQQARLITDFNADTNTASLQGFLTKLKELKGGQKRKIRIAYFGDSMIEGDLLTQTFRQLMQQYFGGSGVGFVPITSPVAKFRQTVSTSNAGSWLDENFKDGKSNRLYLSGHLFRGAGASVQMTDQTIKDSTAILEKALLCGPIAGAVNIDVNGGSTSIHPDQAVNRITLTNDGSHSVKLGVNDANLPVYGISFESESGVIVDNFSFRGITGIEYSRIDSSFLSEIAQHNPYDLIIFQYGVNLLFRPNDKNFSWYARVMLPVVKKIRNCFPESDFLLVSTADRAFRYGGEYKSAIGIDSLVKVQALLAYETNSSFYNQFAAMGGTNSIVEWAKAKPSLANQDYVHPNHRGAEILAQYLFDALMRDYKKSGGQ
jgi:lysophospholipase L1-like esterase